MSEEYSDKVADQVQKETRRIFNKFRQSEYFSSMYKYCQQEADSVVEQLGFFLYGYELIQPKDWSLTQFIGQAYNIQRKCMYSKNFFKALPKVIYHFSLFCEENGIGEFDKEEIEIYYKDLKNGIYDDTFHSSWEDGYQTRKNAYETFF